jgi:hypothetical protein
MARYLVYHPPFKFLRGPIAGLLPRSNPDGQRPDAFILCDTNVTLSHPSLMWVVLGDTICHATQVDHPRLEHLARIQRAWVQSPV